MDESIFEKEKQVQKRIETALLSLEIPASTAYDISFHMTDWFGNITNMQALFGKSDTSDEEVVKFVMSFLAHVPNHLNAAQKLIGLGPVTDVFQVGIFKDDE